jgi:Methyltransferase domain
MQRVDSQELLDSDLCPPAEVETSLRDLCRINRWFGGVRTTQTMIEKVSSASGKKHFTILEVASGLGEVPKAAGAKLARRGITLDITDLDRVPTHLPHNEKALAADALALPFKDASFDVVSCSLFAHHLSPSAIAAYADEASRVARIAVLINDLIRHPLHLALVYAGFPLMRSHVSRVDGVASVKRAYTPAEMLEILRGNRPERRIEISRHFLFRMGVILWK